MRLIKRNAELAEVSMLLTTPPAELFLLCHMSHCLLYSAAHRWSELDKDCDVASSTSVVAAEEDPE